MSVAEGSLPAASPAGTSWDEVADEGLIDDGVADDGAAEDAVAGNGAAFGWPAADDFLSAAVVWEAAAVAGCAGTPGLALLAASRVAAVIGVAFGAAAGAGVAEF